MDIRKLIMVEKEIGLCREQTLQRMGALPPVAFGMPSNRDGHKHRAANEIHPAQPVQGADRVWLRLWGGIHVSVTVLSLSFSSLKGSLSLYAEKSSTNVIHFC